HDLHVRQAANPCHARTARSHQGHDLRARAAKAFHNMTAEKPRGPRDKNSLPCRHSSTNWIHSVFCVCYDTTCNPRSRSIKHVATAHTIQLHTTKLHAMQ